MASRSSKPRRAHEGTQLGDYVLREEIGNGSFASVHKAKNVKKGGYAAVKCVILAKLNNNKKLKENLYGEIRILKSLNHPHIVSLFDCMDSPDYIFLIMEWCPIGDLSHFIKSRKLTSSRPGVSEAFKRYPNPDVGGLNEVLVRHFVKQLGSAVDFMHSRNLIHRDLKPQNVLLSPAPISEESAQALVSDRSIPQLQPVGVPSLPVLKLADFGFARALPPQGLAETLCGSPLYMAPEILRYEKYDGKADLWSVGTVTYEMMTGRPPFRAGNHVELLRTIEKGDDVIRFPSELKVSSALKDLVRQLLKRHPVQRVSFEDFFDHEVITGEIPNLLKEDKQQMLVHSQPEITQAAAMERTASAQRKEETRPAVRPVPAKSKGKDVFVDALDHRPEDAPVRPKPETMATAPAGHLPHVSSRPAQRPSANRNQTEMPPPHIPVSSGKRPEPARRQSTTPQQEYHTPPLSQQETKEEQERAAQEIAFERDYVVVEKKAVEMNALADELQASPRIQGHRHSVGQQQRPSRQTSFQASSAPTSNQVATTRAIQVTGANRPDHLRRTSFERRARAAGSASSAIAKALSMASGRLMNLGFPPPLSRGVAAAQMPIYSPFPAYPAQASQLLLEDVKQSSGPLDDDTRALQALEETATRSDVVFGFAEVKYMQIIPQAPSAEHGLGIRGPGLESPHGPHATEEASDLTPDALVIICEEALVLYVKALSLLARSMDIAGAWWGRKNRGEGQDPSSSSPKDPRTTTTDAQAAARLNSVVQWVRTRFNETLEKAEFVRLKLIDAQRQLPPEHPSHPNNHSAIAGMSSTTATQSSPGQQQQMIAGSMPPGTTTGQGSKDGQQQLGASGVDVYISPGVTADRIMYQRAVEMSRAAAVNELMCEDLPGCEISYVTAIRMLEVVLESSSGEGRIEEQGRQERGGREKAGADAALGRKEGEEDLLDPEDRESVLKMLQGTKNRLHTLRKKMVVMARRNSGNATPVPPPNQRSPKPKPATLATAHASVR